MSEWFKEHAWKSTPSARANAHQILPSHVRSTTSRNSDVHHCVPTNRGVCLWFYEVCDTVLTQNRFLLRSRILRELRLQPTKTNTHHARRLRRPCQWLYEFNSGCDRQRPDSRQCHAFRDATEAALG